MNSDAALSSEMSKAKPTRQFVERAISKSRNDRLVESAIAKAVNDKVGKTTNNTRNDSSKPRERRSKSSENVRPGLATQPKCAAEPDGNMYGDNRTPLSTVSHASTAHSSVGSGSFFQTAFASRSDSGSATAAGSKISTSPKKMRKRVEPPDSSSTNQGERGGVQPSSKKTDPPSADPPAASDPPAVTHSWTDEGLEVAPSYSVESLQDSPISARFYDEKKEEEEEENDAEMEQSQVSTEENESNPDVVDQALDSKSSVDTTSNTGNIPSEAFEGKKLHSVTEVEECEFGLGVRKLPSAPSMPDEIDGCYDSWELRVMASEETIKATGGKRTKPPKGYFVKNKNKKKTNSDDGDNIKSLFSNDSFVAPVGALFDDYDDEFGIDSGDFDDFPDDDSYDEEKGDEVETDSAKKQVHEASEEKKKVQTTRQGVICFDEGGGVEMLETAAIYHQVETDVKTEKKKLHQSKAKKESRKIRIRMNKGSSGIEPGGRIEQSQSDAAEEPLDPETAGFVKEFLSQGSRDDNSNDDTNTPNVVARQKVPAGDDKFRSLQDPPSDDKESVCEEGFLKVFSSLDIADEEEEVAPSASSGEMEVKKADPDGQKDLGVPGVNKYFASLVNRDDNPNLRHFQRLISPVLAGERPTSTEKERIRHVANLADVSLKMVEALFALASVEKLLKAASTVSEEEMTDEITDAPGVKTVGSRESEAAEGETEEYEVKTEKRTRIGRAQDVPASVESIGTESFKNKKKTEKSDAVEEKPDEEKQQEQQEPEDTEKTKKQKEKPKKIKPFKFDKGMSRKVWRKRNEMASLWQTPSSPKKLNGVSAAADIPRFASRKTKRPEARPWRLSSNARTENHSGYSGIDVYSIYESAKVGNDAQDELLIEVAPWEHRDVKQLFLQERSISFSRNWFGELKPAQGNDKYKPPICKPESMKMPIGAPEPGQWTEDMYTTYKSPYEKFEQPGLTITKTSMDDHDVGTSTVWGRGQSMSDDESSSDESYSDSDGGSSRRHDDDSYSDGSEASSYYDDAWEDAPECGEIINMRLRIGEHITRVHPDYTSSLRRSRYRKKYFPKGTFPY